MIEIQSKAGLNDYGSFDIYKLLRDETLKTNMLQMQVVKLQQDVEYMKQILLQITNGKQ